MKRLNRSSVVVATLLACGVTAVLAAELPRGFRLEPVVGGLTEPSAMASTPDGRILIAERTTGRVRQVRLGELEPNAVCTVSVNATGEGGLLGIAVHPRFSVNDWIYLYYTDSVSGRNKVTRFTLTATGCAGGTDILNDLGAGPSFLRNGGGIAFGPDGKLYVATGDVENSSNGQNDAVWYGKVLRVNDDGSVPADNPTPGSLVFAKGVHNGRGLDVNDAGKVFSIDAGRDTGSVYDELNQVPPGGNLGWDLVTGNSGGVYDDPLEEWLPTIGARGLTVYSGSRFPDRSADGKDNDHDRFGPDLHEGVSRVDDDGSGECVGSNNNGASCTSNSNCPPRNNGFYNENSWCEKRDEPDEYCPGGTPYGDDACGASGGAGVDEPDESFLHDVFFAAFSQNRLYRAVLTGPDSTSLNKVEVFLDSNILADCPDEWTAVMEGRDGWLYALARNGGGAGGALYRVIYDDRNGPREVSAPGSHFPLRVEKGATTSEVVLYWEDLRSEATQPRDDGNPNPSLRQPQQPKREYTVWRGTLGSWYSHGPVAGLDAIPGTAVNDALRKTSVPVVPGDNDYFLVSARHANLEGTLGKKSDGTERPGYASQDKCSTIGYHSPPSFDLWKCGKDFSLVDEHGEVHSLYEYRGTVVLLDFSAIWCPPCQSEADKLENLWNEYKDRGVQFLTVLMDEDDQLWDWSGRPTAAECRNWSDRSSAPDHTFPCWVDPVPASSQKAWPNYNKWNAIPTNVILDTGLRVVYSEAGYDENEIRDKLNRLVGSADACLQ